MDNLIIMKISEPLEDLFGVEDNGCFVVFQRTPLGAQQRGQTSYKQDRCQIIKDFISKNAILMLHKQKKPLISQCQTKPGGGFELIFSAYLTTVPLSEGIFFFFTDELNWLFEPPTALADVTQAHLHNHSAGMPTSLMFK